MIIVRPVVLMLALSLVAPQARRAHDAGIPVRFPEGTVHGFVELRTAAGVLLAPGDLIQMAREAGIESRMVFHFADSSAFEETVTFSQHGVFTMLSYHLVQRGPAFADDLDATLSRSGQYVVVASSHRDGRTRRYTGRLELPADVYNGMIIMIAKNLSVRDTESVHIVAFTPRPRLIGLELVPAASRPIALGPHTENMIDFTLKPRLGALLGLFARMLGKMPPDSHAWIVTEDAPAFARFEGPLYAGPVWRINQAIPAWPR